MRIAFGLPPVTSFAQISSDVTVQQKLQATYGTVDQIDLFEGMLAEDHLPGADVGPTIKAILANQFTRLRDGDRFFYRNETINLDELNLILQGNTLAKVIAANTEITNLQSNVFFFKVSISGTVYLDLDKDGNPRTFGEVGLPGFTVNLKDTSGTVLATTKTDIFGHYKFTDQTGISGTGQFSVSLVVPSGFVQTSANPGTILISRGGINVRGEDFGVDLSFLASSAAASPVAPASAGSSSTAAALASFMAGSLQPSTNSSIVPVTATASAVSTPVVQAPVAGYTGPALPVAWPQGRLDLLVRHATSGPSANPWADGLLDDLVSTRAAESLFTSP